MVNTLTAPQAQHISIHLQQTTYCNDRPVCLMVIE